MQDKTQMTYLEKEALRLKEIEKERLKKIIDSRLSFTHVIKLFK